LKILSVSDKKYHLIQSPKVKNRFPDVDLVIGCGDLPYYYLEFISETLNVPLFFVRGNHDHLEEFHRGGIRRFPKGGHDLHRKSRYWNGVVLAGIEGSLQYNAHADFQYTQIEMWLNVLSLVPELLLNKIRFGRYLDIFITHAPPWDIHDEKDRTHQGIKAFRWLLSIFRPHYHFHGHIHVYGGDTRTETKFRDTLVINTYGFRETICDFKYQ
jgi:Icc-related predicted phosphoesterase